jgi:DNA polymerase
VGEPHPSVLEWQDCQRCGLCKTRKNVVLGEGNHKTTIIFFGDKPGPKEDKEGVPMCGDTGVLYNNLLKRVEIDRNNVFTDNIVGCFPAKEDDGKLVIRDPAKEEIQACLPRVWETIYRIDPLAIVAFGANALNALTGLQMKITAARGDTFLAYVPGVYKVVKSYPVFPTFHPAYALRRDRAEHTDEHKWAPQTIKKTIVEDLTAVREFVIKLTWLYEDGV